jgi:predicted transcriptional regulator
MRTYLLSIKPDPFSALVDGRKKHEFRRKFSHINEGFRVVFYVSRPVKAICGIGTFDKPVFATIARLIELIKTHRYSSPQNLKRYLEGLEMGFALPIKKVKTIKPVLLEQIRAIIPGFNPPQSYCSLDSQKCSKLIRGAD